MPVNEAENRAEGNYQGHTQQCNYANPLGCDLPDECKPKNVGTFDANGTKVSG